MNTTQNTKLVVRRCNSRLLYTEFDNLLKPVGEHLFYGIGSLDVSDSHMFQIGQFSIKYATSLHTSL
jgi:hypothetical protein